MPDVLTHLLIGLSLAVIFRPKGTRVEQVLIILGALLIDIERPVTWMLTAVGIDWLGLGSAFHSILGAIILSYVSAACFVLNGLEFVEKFRLILLGSISHLLLDLVMYPWAEFGLYLLYPLRYAFSFNLVWPDYWWYPMFGLAALLVVLCIRFCYNIFEKKRGRYSPKT